MSDSAVIIFPYGVRLREGAAVDTFPAAEVQLPHRDGGWISLFFVVDSGATVSALPKSDALALGIQAEQGASVTVSGIGAHPVHGWRHTITARIGGALIRFPVTFLDDDATPRVLGRAGLFSRFMVIFEERKLRSGFLGYRTREAHRVQKLLDAHQGGSD